MLRRNLLMSRFAFAVLGLLPIMAIGCSDGNLATVTGTVTLDGEPLPNAFITFVPQGETGSTSFGKTDEDGAYEMVFSDTQAGAWVGENVVRITTQDVGMGPGEVIPERVPDAYNENSTLIRTVEPGSNEFHFVLESGAVN